MRRSGREGMRRRQCLSLTDADLERQVYLSLCYIRECAYTCRTGIIMAVHLFDRESPHEDTETASRRSLQLLAAYENGSVALHSYVTPERRKSVEGAGWEKAWSCKLHVESGTPFDRILSLSPTHGMAQ
jgi:hypothetical protein